MHVNKKNMTVSAIIIDDDHLAIERLKDLISVIPTLKVIDTCSTGKCAIEKINLLQPNLIFLDIELKDMAGFSVLDQINTEEKPLVIFLSAKSEFALKAFEYSAFDYLLKPFKDDRFFKTIHNALNRLKYDSFLNSKINGLFEYVKNSNRNLTKDKLAIKLGNKVSFLKMKEIKYIIASGYYAEIYTNDKKHLLRESLTNLTKRLDPNQFIRIHRSTIINIDFISELIHTNFGEVDLKTTDNRLFRISRSYKKEFQELMEY